jgi:hypothetical protein
LDGATFFRSPGEPAQCALEISQALKDYPDWDPLRGDPRFEKIVASLAPKPANK